MLFIIKVNNCGLSHLDYTMHCVVTLFELPILSLNLSTNVSVLT